MKPEHLYKARVNRELRKEGKKWCARCDTVKSLNEFNRAKQRCGRVKVAAACRICNAKWLKDWATKNRESIAKRKAKQRKKKLELDQVYSLERKMRKRIRKLMKGGGCNPMGNAAKVAKERAEALGPCPGAGYHDDHIVPVAFLRRHLPMTYENLFGGWNAQWLTEKENLAKGDKATETGRRLIGERYPELIKNYELWGKERGWY